MAQKLDELSMILLKHMERYRIGLTKFCWMAARTQQASITQTEVKTTLIRLSRDAGYLARAPLFGSQSYFYLSRKYVRQSGGSDYVHHGRPLGEAEKLTAYAMLRTCFANGEPARRKLTAIDFEDHFPQLADELGVSHKSSKADRYYLAGDRLGYLRVDRGGRGRWDRVLGYCDRDITKHSGTPGCRQLVDSGFFELTLVTATSQKARRLRQAEFERPIHDKVTVHVLVVPELLHSLAPPPRVSARFIPHRGF